MFCSKCGSQIIDGAKFCSKCGNPVPQAAAPQAPVAPVKMTEANAPVASNDEETFILESEPTTPVAEPVQPAVEVKEIKVEPVSIKPYVAEAPKPAEPKAAPKPATNADVVKFLEPAVSTSKPVQSQPVTNSYVQPPTPPAKKKKKGNGGLVAIIIILLIVLLAIVGVGSYFLFIDKDGDWYILSDDSKDKKDDKDKDKKSSKEDADEDEDEQDADDEDADADEATEAAEAEVADDSEEPWTPPEVIDGIDTENGTPLEYFNPAEHTYQLLYGDLTWSEASRACEKNDNGHLSCIICYEEIEIVETYLKELGIDQCDEPYVIWLGAYKDNNGYNWVSGEGVGVSNWKAGEPTNGPYENYIVMQYDPDSDSWKWMDVPGDITDEYAGHIAYLCEWEKKAN